MLLFQPPCSEAYNPRLSFRSKSKEQLNERRAGLSMSGNLHLLLAHGSLYMRWAQEEVGVPLGVLTEGSIEVANKDVKAANKKFVSRVSAERIHRDILTRRSWECDPLLHYEMTRHQKIRRGNIRRTRKKRSPI